MDGLNNKIDRAEGRINELEDRSAVIIHSYYPARHREEKILKDVKKHGRQSEKV